MNPLALFHTYRKFLTLLAGAGAAAAELLRCPVAVPGLPTDGGASIPADWRTGIRRLAKSRGDLFDQVSRLIQFHTGEACGDQR